MKYIRGDYEFDSEKCVGEIMEVIKSHEIPFIILDKILEEVKEKVTSSIIIKK